ncbi:Vacuolar protein sorting-associated protein 11 [Chionoecetes opilio]|uniref:Vacuolar protein sorting-associated protein 11 n=1 Tax=Chionoecetes opilio TaxID=41210 RepID=A0A8J5CHN0_CHIOP|nr:Vacuolar protein sorting-associated protein 11 [Chionoecetes opilio]
MFSALLRYLYTGEFNAYDGTSRAQLGLSNLDLLMQLCDEFGTPNPLECDLRYLLESGDHADCGLVFSPGVLRWSGEAHGSAWVHRQALHYLREEFAQTDEGHLSEILPDVALASSSLLALHLQDHRLGPLEGLEGTQMTLDLGDGSHHQVRSTCGAEHEGEGGWGGLYLVTTEPSLRHLSEKDLHTKFQLLFKKNQFDIAISLAKTQCCDQEEVAEILKQYGDWLYSKGNHRLPWTNTSRLCLT